MSSIAPRPTKSQGFASNFMDSAKVWMKEQAKFWGLAIAIHVLGLLLFGLLAGTVAVVVNNGEVPLFESVMDTIIPEADLTQVEVDNAPLEVTELSTETLMMSEAPTFTQEAQFNDDSATFVEAGGGVASATDTDFGGLGGFTVSGAGTGAAIIGEGGVGAGKGTGKNAGSGGAGEGFGGRGQGSREAMVGSSGGTKATERSVSGGLNWIAQHQNPDGSWSFDGYSRHCKDASCSCQGTIKSDTGATAFALLPFLAAGQTHKSKGRYQRSINEGITYLARKAKPNGALFDNTGGNPRMYVHGVATIVLCEAYGMSKDRALRDVAQNAVQYICNAQNPELGGWHYAAAGEAPMPGDLSVVGWQLMALKSAKMAGLNVPPVVLEKSTKFLKSVSKGKDGGLGSYMVDSNYSPAMTAVLLLSKQFLGAKRSNADQIEGMKYMLQNMPGKAGRNSYYFYYATQVMHNFPGAEWDQWNRATRKYLIETQEKKGCATGSWNPLEPAEDAWGKEGGRLLCTSINTLNLEVYYRYLPLYKLDKEGQSNEDDKMDKPAFGK